MPKATKSYSGSKGKKVIQKSMRKPVLLAKQKIPIALSVTKNDLENSSYMKCFLGLI